ncbi:MAG: hypothetical protein WCQ50_20050 [Spirochaetota bacterium]
MKSHIVVLQQSGRPSLEGTVKALREKLETSEREVVVFSARDVPPQEIQAGSAFILAAEDIDADSFAEAARVFKGVNLSGRRVGYLGYSGAVVAWLKDLSADAELSRAVPDLIGSTPDSAALSAFVRAFD